jgi:flagellar biosynthetic protein FlhB
VADTQFQDKTEPATPKRLEEARRKGQIPRSRELSMTAVLLAGTLLLYADGASLTAGIRDLMVRSLSFDARAIEDPARMMEAFASASYSVLALCMPLFAALSAAAVLGSLAVGGWIFTPEPVAPRFERLDPVAGLGRIFSLNGFVEVLKAVAKATFIAAFAVGVLWLTMDSLLGLSDQPLQTAMSSSLSLSLLTLGACSGALLLVAAIDAPYQLWSYQRQMRMTRQEVEDELKESEGRPEVRNRIRQLQQETARRRMLEDVAKADVVVTNPTHFAVALRYDENRMRAPVVVAKGVDLMAGRIRAVADEHRVALFEAPLLARALYWTTDLGREIPAQLYLAVAQVLTYVYRLKNARIYGGAWPERPVVTVDETLASRPARRRGRQRPVS